MKAETADYLAKARAKLADAQQIALAQVLPPGLTVPHGPRGQP